MVDTKKIAKKVAKGALDLTAVASIAAKNGILITEDFAKTFLCGADNLTNQLVGNGLEIGIGKKTLEYTEKAFEWGADKVIKIQKEAKGLLK